MINAKVKVFKEEYSHNLEVSINTFLETIDIRQVIKTDFSISSSVGYTINYTAIIYYVSFEDIRGIKLEKILEI